MSGPASVGPPGSNLPPPPYPGFSPSHSPASASAPGSVGAPHLPPSPQFYPPKPSPSHASSGAGPSSLLASQLQHQSPHYHCDQQEKDRLRFQTELEFVQCLGNPNYLNFLAQRGYFKESNFINYLKYLQYWKEPGYVKFVKYPVCLHFLELLQHEAFRKEIVNTQVSTLILWCFSCMTCIGKRQSLLDMYLICTLTCIKVSKVRYRCAISHCRSKMYKPENFQIDW